MLGYKRTSIVLLGHYFRGDHYSFLRQYRVIPSDEGGEAISNRGGEITSTGSGEIASTGKEDSSEFSSSIPQLLLGLPTLHDSNFQHPIPS